MVIWNMNYDIENSAHEVTQNARLFYDAKGNTMITQGDEMIMCD